ncbi:MAG: SWIM zinc finger family protein, partial [Desulfuromonadales bacterium]|nr:SWIM zinc finger family protein [Desulfuromonadales bacterium]
MKSIREMLKGVTLEDLRDWAGSKIYNRGKGYVSNVSQLSRTEDGTLVAWVSGSDEYATSVRHEGKGDFDSDCTCPYDDWGPCKHAVAVLLAAAEQLKQYQDIPLLDPDDDLYLEAFDEDDDWLEEDEDDDREESSSEPPKGRSPQLEKQLADKSRDELQALLIELALDFPEVSRRLRDTIRLETGQVDKLVHSLRKEIRCLTAEDAWYNPWKHEGNLPDYTHVEEQLEALLNEGHADAVLELGEELWERGIEQVEQSHDDGETALAISACLAIVLRALQQTSLPQSEQLLWLVEHELDDQYELLDGADAVLNDPRYTPEDWREVAAVLES